MYLVNIVLVAKPRMTRSDKWKKRPATTNYWRFKDDLIFLTRKAGYELSKKLFVVFLVQMPESWSEKKKKLMDGTRHEPKPDADNFCKSVMDCLKPSDDSMITPICGHKKWARNSGIIFFDTLSEWVEYIEDIEDI